VSRFGIHVKIWASESELVLTNCQLSPESKRIETRVVPEGGDVWPVGGYTRAARLLGSLGTCVDTADAVLEKGRAESVVAGASGLV
jgi:hypothetical protein